MRRRKAVNVTLATILRASAPRRPRAIAAAFAGLLAGSLSLTAGPAHAQNSTPPGDPPGNNGTIKIVESGSDDNPGNEPQLDGCLVWLEFYGFDTDQQSVITFREVPPTGDGQVLLTHTAEISDDAAGGGQDKDATLSYNLSAALGSLTTSDPDKGYHVKVTSDTVGAPGGAKQKIFWMRCATSPPGALRVSKTVEGDGSNAGPFAFSLLCNHSPLDETFTLGNGGVFDVTGVPSGTVCVITETANGGAIETRLVESPGDGNDDGTFRVATGTVSSVAFTNVFPAAAVAGVAAEKAAADKIATEVAAAEASRVRAVQVDRLPETGLATNIAAATGIFLIAAGSFMVHRTSRRRYWL